MSANPRPLHRLAVTIAQAGATAIGAVDPPPVAEAGVGGRAAPAVVPPPSVGVDKGGGRAPAGPGPKLIDKASQKCCTVAPARGGRF